MLFLIFVNLTVLLCIAAVVLHFSDITSDPKWEKWCGQAIVFTIIPIIVIPAVRVFGLPVHPMVAVALIWILMVVMYLQTQSSKRVQEEVEMRQEGYWKCGKCHEYNPKLNLVCWKCSTKKETK